MRVQILAIFVMLLGSGAVRSAAIDVYESTLAKNKVYIRVSDTEAKSAAKDSKYATVLGVEAAKGMIRLSGIPESITGKIAAAGTGQILSSKYAEDIRRCAREYGQGFTLRYDVDLEGVRAIWAASAVGDPFVPGTPAAKAIVDILNRLANYGVHKSR